MVFCLYVLLEYCFGGFCIWIGNKNFLDKRHHIACQYGWIQVLLMRSTQAICGTCQVTVAAINLACMGYSNCVNLITEFLVGALKINFGSMNWCRWIQDCSKSHVEKRFWQIWVGIWIASWRGVKWPKTANPYLHPSVQGPLITHWRNSF